MEYLIRNGGVKEEVYLQEVKQDVYRDLSYEHEYGRTPAPSTRKRRKKWEWSCIESHEEEPPKGGMTATWTPDETKATYFKSKKEAQAVFEKWPKLMRNAVIVEAGI